ncbi:hypothetical protein [Aneurinibacillus terranovensis]|uniref:hypothetical protein n=1 Tax=Aneurinibacillus terranovensis TaxID=278991 RepID=UPI0003FDDF16|nr:hypothetical protein [Aneurinibacillus terranovensis]
MSLDVFKKRIDNDEDDSLLEEARILVRILAGELDKGKEIDKTAIKDTMERLFYIYNARKP